MMRIRVPHRRRPLRLPRPRELRRTISPPRTEAVPSDKPVADVFPFGRKRWSRGAGFDRRSFGIGATIGLAAIFAGTAWLGPGGTLLGVSVCISAAGRLLMPLMSRTRQARIRRGTGESNEE